MSPEEFEPATPASKLLQTHTFDCATTGISIAINHRPLMALSNPTLVLFIKTTQCLLVDIFHDSVLKDDVENS